MTSCRDILRKYSIQVTIEGVTFRYLSPPVYRTHLLKCIALIFICVVTYLLQQIPYHHITIISNTVYGRVAAACLSQQNIPYVICRGHNTHTYYETEDGDEISFEGPSMYNFDLSDETYLIHHSEEELEELTKHTSLSHLAKIQEYLYKGGKVKLGDLIHNDKIKGNIITVKPIAKNLYYIVTRDEAWITRLIITDNISPLQPGEVISELRYKIIPELNLGRQIIREDDTCVVIEPDKTTILSHFPSYKVETDLSLHSLSDFDDAFPGIFYQLEKPRPFSHSIYNIHPFHLAKTYDPFLSIMIVTLGIVMGS